MNYDQPRELEDKSGWHYTTHNKRTGTHPIGYCREHGPHATEAEARECYASYLRDNVKLDPPHTWSWCTCDYGTGEYGGERQPCPNPANSGARSGPWRVALLCDEHFTREHAIEALGLDKPAGDSWHS